MQATQSPKLCNMRWHYGTNCLRITTRTEVGPNDS